MRGLATANLFVSLFVLVSAQGENMTYMVLAEDLDLSDFADPAGTVLARGEHRRFFLKQAFFYSSSLLLLFVRLLLLFCVFTVGATAFLRFYDGGNVVFGVF